jgi:hypothetical protein
LDKNTLSITKKPVVYSYVHSYTPPFNFHELTHKQTHIHKTENLVISLALSYSAVRETYLCKKQEHRSYAGSGLTRGEQEGHLVGKDGRLLGHAEDEHDPEGGDGAEDADVEEEQVQLPDVVGRVQIVDRQQLG